MAWTPDRVEILTEMWMEGKSASLIATELGGVTRNAVIGKVHRLGLSNRNIDKKQNTNKTKTINKENKKIKDNKLETAKNNISKDENKSVKNRLTPKKNVKIEIKDFEEKQSNEKSVIFDDLNTLESENITPEVSEEFLKNVKTVEKKSKKLSLMELTERHCKWPIGDPATDKFWFCGLSSEPGKPYCETHIELAFQPITSKRERRLK
mgnify:CR=1 FL=1